MTSDDPRPVPGAPEVDLGAQPHVRLVVAVLVGLVAGTALTVAGAGRFAPLGGWITTAAIYSAWTWANIVGMDPGSTASHATREAPGRAATSLLLICGALASLVGVGFQRATVETTNADRGPRRARHPRRRLATSKWRVRAQVAHRAAPGAPRWTAPIE